MLKSSAAVGCSLGEGESSQLTQPARPPGRNSGGRGQGGDKPRARKKRGPARDKRAGARQLPGTAAPSPAPACSSQSSASEVSVPSGSKADTDSQAGVMVETMDTGTDAPNLGFEGPFRSYPSVVTWLGIYAPKAPVAAEEPPPERKSRKSIGSRIWAKVFSVAKWRKKQQLTANAAEAVALYRSVDVDGEDYVEVVPTFTLGETVGQAINDRLRTPTHNVRHRAARRFRERTQMLKELSAELKYQYSGFGKTEADLRSLAIAAKSVVDKALDSKVIHKAQANWYKCGLVACYHIADEDDELFAGFAARAVAGSM